MNIRTSKTKQSERIIGDIEGAEPGPTVIVLGAVHGNEYTGVETLSNLFSRLESEKPHFRGRLIGLQGNMKAIQRHYRFVDEDLNRIWSEDIVRKVKQTARRDIASVERRELKDLLEIIDPLLKDSGNQSCYVIDLHSFSASDGMFAISNRRESHTQIVGNMDVPVVHGLENELGGTVLDYFRRKGHVALAFEGGQHGDDKTVKNKMALLYQLLEKTGNLGRPREYNELQTFTDYLQNENKSYPARTELVYRYRFEEGDQFSMHPGYSNFQWVRKGQHVADDRHGRIEALHDGYILMPLYQDQGNDGFFLIRHQ